MIQYQTLVLNADYQPIYKSGQKFPWMTIQAEDAITRVFNNTCHVVSEYPILIKTPNHIIKWPSVIAKNKWDNIIPRVALQHENLYYRDHGVCAYCGIGLTLAQQKNNSITKDHVIPRDRGGEDIWENVVAACPRCNHTKGRSLPVGKWAPRVIPFAPSYWQILEARKKFPISVQHESWIDYIGDWTGGITINSRVA